MAVLVAAAFVWDSVRFLSAARHRLNSAESELQQQEDRLVALLSGTPEAPTELVAALAAYRGSETPGARRAAYDELVNVYRKTGPSEIDPAHPLDRKFMDDIAGAINRRDVAKKQLDSECSRFDSAISSFRGRIGRSFSSQDLSAGN